MKSRMILILMCGSSLLCSSEIKKQKVWTDLHEAASSGDTKRVSELLDCGADRDAQSQDGSTALDLAKSKNHPEVIKLLQPLVTNMLEDNTLSNGIRGYDNISLLSRKEIGSLIMQNHPIVAFILNRVNIPSIIFEKHTAGKVYSAVFNGSEDKVLISSGDFTARILNVVTGDCHIIFAGHTEIVYSAVFNGRGDRVLTSSYDFTARILNVATGDCLVTFTGHTGSVYSAVFNGSENKVLTASEDGTAKIWNVATGNCLVTFTGHTDMVYSAVFNGSENKVLTASGDGTAKIWDVASGNCLVTFTGHTDSAFSAVFNRSENKVLTASRDGTAKIWDVATGNCLVTLTGDAGVICSAVFNEKEDKVLTASWVVGTAKIWDAATGNCLVTLTGHTKDVNSALFNGCEDKVLTSSDDGTVRIWDINIFNKLEKFFSRDEKIKKKVTLKQALLLDAIYEILVLRRLAQLRKKKEPTHFNGTQPGTTLQDWLAFDALKTEAQRKAWIINQNPLKYPNELVFDFAVHSHLQDAYRELPDEIKAILSPYVKEADQDDESSKPAKKRKKMN